MVDEAFGRLQRANPVVGDVGAPPIEDVLSRLGDAPDAAASAGRKGRLASVLVVSVAVTVVVAVGALFLSAHRRHTAGAAASGVSVQAPPGVSVQAHQLVSLLAVLRRPQTAADRAVPWTTAEVPRRFYDGPVPTLTRRVFTFPGGRGLFMVVLTHPTAFGAPPALSPRLGDGVALWSLCCNGSGEPAAALRAHTQLLPEERGVPGGHAEYYAYSVIPDGVARVKWVFAPLRSPTRTWPRTTIWAKVQNNVAVAPVVPIPRAVSSATWYAADGRVVAHQVWTSNRHVCESHSNRCASYR
jgi:hypothetical protein